MPTPQTTTQPDAPDQPLHPLLRRLCKLIDWCERMIAVVASHEPIHPADQALLDADSKPVHQWPAELRERVIQSGYWSVLQLKRIIDANGHKLTPRQVMHGLIDAVADSDIDLSGCRSEADVKRTVLEILQRNSRSVKPGGGE